MLYQNNEYPKAPYYHFIFLLIHMLTQFWYCLKWLNIWDAFVADGKRYILILMHVICAISSHIYNIACIDFNIKCINRYRVYLQHCMHVMGHTLTKSLYEFWVFMISPVLAWLSSCSCCWNPMLPTVLSRIMLLAWSYGQRSVRL